MSQDWIIGASIDDIEEVSDTFKKQDPFNKSWDDIKNLSGLDANFKRRAARLSKNYNSSGQPGLEPSQNYMNSALAVASGLEDAKSKEINPGTVFRNGYGMFDVITPPWNLYELANYYDTSFANHAAIDAKVENIVGLGYDFEVSKRTLMRLESNSDSTAVDRARARIERAKIEMKDWLENLNDEESFTHTLTKFYTDVQATGNGYLEIGRTIKGKIGYIGHIPATTMRARRLKDGYVQIIGQKVVYFRNLGQRTQTQLPLTQDQTKLFTTKNTLLLILFMEYQILFLLLHLCMEIS
jgi:hypothetical protein